MNKQNKLTRGLFLAFLALFMLIPSSLEDIHIVNASVGGGSGGIADNGIQGKWYYAHYGAWPGGSKNSETWNKWRGWQSDRTNSQLSERLRFAERNGIGGFGGLSLETSCKRSEFIWWYGGKSTKRWHTEIGNAHPTKKQMRDSTPSPLGKLYLDEFFKMSGNGWGKPGGTIIICSGSLAPVEPPKIPITITGDTKYFLYNGKQHKVTTWTRSGSLRSGHTAKASALGTRTNPGSSDVNVTNARVVDSNNNNVSSQYNITTKKGKIYVRDLPSGPDKRCVTKSTETVKGYTENKVTVAPGFLPEGAPAFNTMTSTKNTEAKSKLSSSNLPKVGQSKSTWDTWKKDFEKKGKDTSTNDITSIGGGPAQIIGEHGGVLNVTRTHTVVEVKATLCQPQKREAKLNDKNQAVWGEWTNDGGLEIEKITTKNLTPETYSYQILGVNCNVPGVERVKKDFNIEKDHSYGNGQASALLETAVRKGTHFPLGQPSHYTGKSNFYTDGESCQEQFADACVSKKLGTSAKNDANNNLQVNPLFTHEDETEHGYPNNNDELVFFRDNEDRTVRADVWYPKKMSESGLITDPNAPAEKTIVKLYGGTPEIDITTIETSTGSKKETKIDKFDEEFTINDHVNKFNMKSQWASDENKPYELGIDWVYKAKAVNKVPSSINGDKVRATKDFERYSADSDGFEVHCQFMNNKGEYAAQIPKNPFIDSKVTNFKWNEDNAIRALFSRSVSDKSRQND